MHLPAGSSLPNTHYRVSAKGIIFNEQGELFISEEYDDFDLPGGGIDHGETAYEGLEREIYEETSCSVVIGKQPLCTRVRHRQNGIWYFFVGYSCKIDTSKFIASNETNSYHFFSKEYLLSNRNLFRKQEYIIDNYDELLHMYRNTDFNS